jgi:hypothetical protein
LVAITKTTALEDRDAVLEKLVGLQEAEVVECAEWIVGVLVT